MGKSKSEDPGFYTPIDIPPVENTYLCQYCDTPCFSQSTLDIHVGMRHLEPPHEHNWQFVETFMAAGEPRVTQRMLIEEFKDGEIKPKMEMRMDARREYAKFICHCGATDRVQLK